MFFFLGTFVPLELPTWNFLDFRAFGKIFNLFKRFLCAHPLVPQIEKIGSIKKPFSFVISVFLVVWVTTTQPSSVISAKKVKTLKNAPSYSEEERGFGTHFFKVLPFYHSKTNGNGNGN